MKIRRVQKTIIITTAIFMVATTAAFAQGGWVYDGRHKGPMMGYQCRPMMDQRGCPLTGPGNYGARRGADARPNALSEAEIAKLEPVREKFHNETESLRLNLNEKRFALNQEMSKRNPDAQKAAQLQKELSALKADFAQKALQHRLEVRQLLPERSFGPGAGRGMPRGAGGY
jgi:Spy/CpxP family protein refolding chaperone